MLLPPKTGNQELDSFLEQLSSYILSLPAQPYYNRGSGEVKSLDTKQTLSYLYRYLHVKFADNTIGLNFSDNPAGRSYYGFSNSESSTAPVDYASYSWYPLPTGQVFGTDNLYYRNLGSRTIDTAIQSAPPNHTWSLYSNTIDLDKLIPANSISADEIGDGAVTEIKLANNSVTTNKINNGAVSLSKLATTGTPSSSTFLAGNMQWVEPAPAGWFLGQTLLSGNIEISKDNVNGHVYAPPSMPIGRSIFGDTDIVPIGSTITIVNLSLFDASFVPDADDIVLLGSAAMEPYLIVASDGMAKLLKVESNMWVVLDSINATGTSISPLLSYLTTEASDFLITEDGDFLIMEF